jgi:predicted nucleotidyltransferase component of viral defense system
MSKEQSILQQIKNKAREKKLPYQLILQLFCQEEFLRRLSRSRYMDNFILKGGLFLFSYYGFEGRPTMDIDFLMRKLKNDRHDVRNIIEEIIDTPTEYDYIQFEIKVLEDITEQREYSGLRVKLIGKIGNTRTPFDIDLGVDDVIVPAATDRFITTQLLGFPQPKGKLIPWNLLLQKNGRL